MMLREIMIASTGYFRESLKMLNHSMLKIIKIMMMEMKAPVRNRKARRSHQVLNNIL